MSNNGRIRIGITGGGSIARSHLDGYLEAPEEATVTAIADIDLDSARHLAGASSPVRLFRDYREMLASDIVDAVDICLPHHLHAEAIVAAAQAGKHVLSEKPLCLTIDEAHAVQQSVAKAGITLMCSHNQLFLPAVATARRLLRDGIIGKVYEARTTDSFYNDLDPSTMGWRGHRWMIGGGALIDSGYHPTYLLLHLSTANRSRSSPC